MRLNPVERNVEATPGGDNVLYRTAIGDIGAQVPSEHAAPYARLT